MTKPNESHLNRRDFIAFSAVAASLLAFPRRRDGLA